jgi:hypothetical protein
MGGEPTGDLRVQRFAGAAHHPQLAVDGRTGLGPGGDDLPVRCGRAGKIGDTQPRDDVVQPLHAETGFAEGGGLALQQRADHGVIQAIGPAGIGDVPEHVLWAQVHGQLHVTGKGQQCA